MESSAQQPSSTPLPADPSGIIDLLNGFRRSSVLFSAVHLGIFDALAGSHKCCNAGQLVSLLRPNAATTPDHEHHISSVGADFDVDSLSRLLAACVSLQLLSYTASDSSYSLTPASAAFLTTSSPCNLAGYATHSANVVYPLFGGLHHSIRTGRPCWQEQLGMSGTELFKHVYRTPEALLSFMTGMHSFAQLSAVPLLQSFDLSWVQSAIDLGGATGAVMFAAVRLLPGMRSSVIVDLEPVVQAATSHFTQPPFVSKEESEELLSRVQWLAADVFDQEQQERIPAGVDLVVMTRILHDWDLARIQQLLQLAWGKIRPGGAILIGEMLLQDESVGAVTNPAALLQDLNMLVQTGGRERNLTQYTELLQDAGFGRVQGKVTGSYLDAIIAFKA